MMFKDLLNEVPEIIESRITQKLDEITQSSEFENLKGKKIERITDELSILQGVIDYYIVWCSEIKYQIELESDGQ